MLGLTLGLSVGIGEGPGLGLEDGHELGASLQRLPLPLLSFADLHLVLFGSLVSLKPLRGRPFGCFVSLKPLGCFGDVSCALRAVDSAELFASPTSSAVDFPTISTCLIKSWIGFTMLS